MITYTIFAGVNGSGKTTLYRSIDSGVLGIRINTDEIVKTIGSWKDAKVQIEAGKKAIILINNCIEEKMTFHQETTLTGHSIMKNIEKAKNNGFKVVMNYVGVETSQIAKDRVRYRVSKGGHGIDEDIIEKRYHASLENLKEIISVCDTVNIFDNSKENMVLILKIENGKIEWKSDNIPCWIKKMIKF